jgi:hypothetical protein
VASVLLLERAHLLLPLASELGDSQPVLESAIRGSSMSPAIPAGACLRVRPIGQRPCQVGDVVFYLADGGYTVHRVVYRARRASGLGYLLTAGDARFAPDPPVPSSRVLGTVVAVQSGSQWRPTSPLTPGPWYQRVVRAITLAVMIAALWLSATAAHWLADVLLSLESRSRLALRRLRHGRRGAAGASPPAGAGHEG